MNATTPSGDPSRIEREIHATRAELDHTLTALEQRLSVSRRVNSALGAMSPQITTLIRLDHTHVLAAFRRFHPGLSPTRKRALVANVCMALEVHAQLEEEIFYPALRRAIGDDEVLNKSVSEHDEARRLIATLRRMEPFNSAHDETFRELVRAVLHHVADEETVLLPRAEIALRDDLRRLGWLMTRRRVELLRPRAAEVATTTARTFPVGTAGAALAVGLTLGWLLVGGRSRVR